MRIKIRLTGSHGAESREWSCQRAMSSMSGSVYFHGDTLAAFGGKARVSEDLRRARSRFYFRMHSIIESESNNF